MSLQIIILSIAINPFLEAISFRIIVDKLELQQDLKMMYSFYTQTHLLQVCSQNINKGLTVKTNTTSKHSLVF